MSEVFDLGLAPSGEQKIEWARRYMPLLAGIRAQFEEEKPFAGLKVALSVHMEAKTACLCRVMELGGAEMHVTGCNQLSTQDDVAAALAAKGMDVMWFATVEETIAHLPAAAFAPDAVIEVKASHAMHFERIVDALCKEKKD